MAKSKAKMYSFSKEDKELFKDVEFLIEATHHEQHQFWVDYHYKPRADSVEVKSWEPEMRGHMITIGELDKRPICVEMYYAKLNGKRVLFYNGCSQLVDHQMIEDWLQHYTLKTIKWDNGTRWAHCDSNNFHHCLEYVKATRVTP